MFIYSVYGYEICVVKVYVYLFCVFVHCFLSAKFVKSLNCQNFSKRMDSIPVEKIPVFMV